MQKGRLGVCRGVWDKGWGGVVRIGLEWSGGRETGTMRDEMAWGGLWGSDVGCGWAGRGGVDYVGRWCELV